MRTTRVVPAVLVAVAMSVAVAGSAGAHVTVNPQQATQGSYTKVAFRVPNERPDSGTVKLEVSFPTDRPITSVSVRPVSGWTVDVERTRLPTPVRAHGREISEVVSKVTWTGGTIRPGEFEEFDVSVGPLPEAERLLFKALQTYASGEVVRWIEEPVAGGPEPAFPAPVLELTAASSASAPETELAAETTGSAADAGDGTDAIAVAGLGLRALALVVDVAALLRRRPA